MKTNIKPLARKKNVVIQEINGEILIYDLNKNNAFCLNATSASVWQLSNGKKTVSEISDEMSRKMKTPVSEEVVWLALNQLENDGLLENGESTRAYFYGMSRREVIKKVGFTSLVALPIVTSIVAPTASMAQSGCFGAGTVCTLNSDCCTNACVGSLCCVTNAGLNLPPNTLIGCVPTGTCAAVGADDCCNGTGVEGLQGACQPTERLCSCAP